MLESQSTYDDDDMNKGVSKSTRLEPKIKKTQLKKQDFDVGQHAIWRGGGKI